MSRTRKKPSHFWSDWWKKEPWKYTTGGHYSGSYKWFRKLQQREFRQATRMALIHHREVPDLPPFDWWRVD